MAISIKLAKIEDAQRLWEIQTEAFAPLYEKYQDENNPYLKDVNDVLGRIKMSRYRYFTIWDDDEIVGGVLYRCKGGNLFIDELQPGEYYLQRVYVAPHRQREGIARAAIRVCELFFMDATTFYVDFPIDLEKNKRCYETIGFIDTGKRERVSEKLELALYAKQTDRVFA